MAIVTVWNKSIDRSPVPSVAQRRVYRQSGQMSQVDIATRAGWLVAWWLGGVVRHAWCAPWCRVGKYWLGRRVGRVVRVQSARREGGGIGRRHHAGPPRPSSEGPSSQWPRSRFTSKMVMMASMDDHERKVVLEFCHLLEKSKQLFNGLRDLPQYGHKQWQGYFGRTFDIYTKLWKFQQQHRWVKL